MSQAFWKWQREDAAVGLEPGEAQVPSSPTAGNIWAARRSGKWALRTSVEHTKAKGKLGALLPPRILQRLKENQEFKPSHSFGCCTKEAAGWASNSAFWHSREQGHNEDKWQKFKITTQKIHIYVSPPCAFSAHVVLSLAFR